MGKIARRALLQGASAVALAASAQGQTKLLSGGRTIPGRSLIVNAYLTSFAGEFQWLNILKGVVSQSASFAYGAVFNAKQYPTGTIPSGIGAVVQLQPTYNGQHICRWTGTGSIIISWSGGGSPTVQSGGGFVAASGANFITITGANPTVVFTFPWVSMPLPYQIGVGFTSGATFTGMADAVLARYANATPDDNDKLIAGQILTTEYIAKMQQGNFRIVRNLGWSNPNDGNNNSLWAYRCPVDAFTYGAPTYNPGLWAGDTAGTNTYTCSNSPDFPSASWTNKEIIQVRFTVANTSGAVTLTVGLRPAKTVVDEFILVPSVGGIALNSQATLVYDSTLDVLIWKPGGLRTFVPPEVQVSAANALGMDCWLTLPHLIDDASVTSFAAMVRANLNSNLNAYFELSNETWNSSSGFPQTYWFTNIGNLYGWPASHGRNDYSSYALRHRVVMGLVTAAWSPRTSSQLNRVMNLQSVADPTDTASFTFNGYDLASSHTMACTISNASPGIVTAAGSNPIANQPIVFSGGSVPSPLSLGVTYYIKTVQSVGSGTFSISATAGGAEINTSGTGSTTATITNPLYTGTDYSTPVGNRPIDYTDIISYATYFTGAQCMQFQGDYLSKGGSGKIQNLIDAAAINDLAWLDNDIRAGLVGGVLGNETLLALTAQYDQWQTLCTTYSPQKYVVNYEGAFGCIAPTEATLTTLGYASPAVASANIAALILNYQNSDYARQIVGSQFQQMMARANSRAPAWLQLCGDSQWTPIPGSIFGTPYGFWYGMMNFNS